MKYLFKQPFSILVGTIAALLFSNFAFAQTGVEQYESQPEGRLEDAQLTGAMVTPVITRRLNVRVGKGQPSFVMGDTKDIPSALSKIMDEKGRLALLLIDGDKIVFEGHRAPSSPQTLNMGLSMSKTLVGAAVGQAFCDGKISKLTDQAVVYVPELKGLSFGAATIEDLLLMRGGGIQGTSSGQARIGMFRALLFHKETLKDQMVETGKGSDAPGLKFNYDNMSTQSLVSVLEKATGQSYFDLLSVKLFAPIEFEIQPAFFVDKDGILISAGGLHASTRDWARVGLLMQSYWTGSGGDCLMNYFKYGYQSKDRNGYGFQVWMHKESGERKIARMSGALGQNIFFNNFNKKVLVTFSNAASRRNLDQFVESWMLN